MKKSEIKKTLKQRIKEAQKHLKNQLGEYEKIRKETELGYDRELLGGLQHPIGYLTAVIEESKNTLRLIDMTHEELLEERRQIKAYEKATEKHLKKVIKELESEDKTRSERKEKKGEKPKS